MWQVYELILLEFQGGVAGDCLGLVNPSSVLPGTTWPWALSEEESSKSCGLEMLPWIVFWWLRWGQKLSGTLVFDFF